MADIIEEAVARRSDFVAEMSVFLGVRRLAAALQEKGLSGRTGGAEKQKTPRKGTHFSRRLVLRVSVRALCCNIARFVSVAPLGLQRLSLIHISR